MAAMVYWPQLLAYMLTLGLPSALVYRLKSHPDEASRIVASMLWLGVALGGVAIAVGFFLIPMWLSQYPIGLIRVSQFAMVVAPLALIGLMLVAVAQVQPELKIFNVARTSYPLVTLFLLVVLVLWDALQPISAAITFFFGNAVVNILLIIWAWRKFSPQWSGSVAVLRGLLSYGMRSYGVELLRVFSTYFDRMIVLLFLDATSMGLYVVALSLAQMLSIIPNGVSSVLFPRVSGQTKEAVMQTTGQAVRISMITAFSAGMLLAVLGPYLLGFVYGDEFTSAAWVLRMLTAYIIISGMALILEQSYMALGMPGRISMLQGAAYGMGIPVLIWMVQEYGIEGAGTSLLGMALLRFALVYASISYSIGVPAPSLAPRLYEVRQVFRHLKRHIAAS